MSYHPHHGRDPYAAQAPDGYGPPGDYPYRQRRHDDGANTVAAIIRVVVGVIVTIFVLHVLFVVLHANRGNDFVSIIYMLAKTFVLGLGDVFTPRDAMLGVALNYGLAALIYLVLGQLVVKALQRR
jgi:hypothetical protein